MALTDISLRLTWTNVHFVFAPQGCLPLVLMFDIKEDIEVEPQCITALMEQLDVFISIKPKPKQPSKVRHLAHTHTVEEFFCHDGGQSNNMGLKDFKTIIIRTASGEDDKHKSGKGNKY